MASKVVGSFALCFGLAVAVPDGVYTIRNLKGYFLKEYVSDGVAVGNPVMVWPDASASESQWRVTTISGNNVSIQNVNSGYFLATVLYSLFPNHVIVVSDESYLFAHWCLEPVTDSAVKVGLACGRQYLTEDVSHEYPNGGWVIVDDGSHALESHWGFQPVHACAVEKVVGQWVPQFSVSSPTKVTFKHGTTKTKAESKTEAWSAEVTASVEDGLEIEGFGVTASVSETLGFSLSKAYSREWSMNTEEVFEVAFEETDVGKYVWQFAFSVGDVCHSGAEPITKEYALTSGVWEEPCCVPGFCIDAPFCIVCHAREYLIPGADARRCTATSELISV